MVLEARPAALAPPGGWDAFILRALDQAVAQLPADAGTTPLDRLAWAETNKVRVAHLMGDAIPGLGRFLNMPVAPVAGCGFCVRVAAGVLGASERLVVAPGREEEGLFHMPGGQSGHPLSRHYGDQQSAWVEGRALRFAPGAAVATLTLAPAPARTQAISLER
jgi:penicillin G amidase